MIFDKPDDSDIIADKELKIFLGSENQKKSAEFFLNINEKEHWIQINEKDEEYRKLIIELLSGR